MNDDESLVDQLKRLYAINGTVTGNLAWDPMYNTITSSNTSVMPPNMIQGEMLVVSLEFDQDAVTMIGKDAVKRQLAEKLAAGIVEHKMVEFTQMTDPINFKTIVKARIFLVPSDDVQLLRKAGY